MDFGWSEEQTAVRELARRVLAEQLSEPDTISGSVARARAVWRVLGQAQLLGVALPAAVGGSDAGFVALCALLECAGEVACPLPVAQALVHAALPLARAGAGDALLRGICSGERSACAALGSRGEPALTARKVASGWELDGIEECVLGLPLADAVVAAARTESGGRILFLLDAAAIRCEPQRVASGCPLGRLVVNALQVSDEAVIGAADGGDGSYAWTLERAYVAQCAFELGLGQRALALSARFAREREQFGRPIGTFQAVAQRLADAHIALETMRLTLWRAAWLLEQGGDAAIPVAVARSVAAHAGHVVVCAAQHVHGSMGFDRSYPLHRYFLASKVNQLALGGHAFHVARLGALLAQE